MTPTYSQSDLYEMVDGMVHQKFAQCNDRQVIVNRAVRYVLGDMDLRSMKRSAQLSPNMFENQFDYAAPTDLKGEKLIDFRRQVQRPSWEKWLLVDESDFDRRKNISNHRVAVRNENFLNLLRIDGLPNTKKSIIHNCNSLTANGTWAVVAGTDASNLTLDTDNYITGNGALNWDMAKGAATGAIELTGATQVDLTDYDEIGSLFAWVYIPDYSDAQGDTVTNFILRWGNDSSNYWSRTITTNNEGNTFHDGWNLLRFDWNGASETGTVDPATIDYARLTVTKSTSLEADTDWRLDDITVQVGQIYDTVYYSKYGWQTSAGAYQEESSATTDLLVADTDEVEIIASKCAEFASQELKEYDDMKMHRFDYENSKQKYETSNPSEALKKSRNYAMIPRYRF